MWQDNRLKFSKLLTADRDYDIEWLNHIWRPNTIFTKTKSVTLHQMSVPYHSLHFAENNTIEYKMTGPRIVLSDEFRLLPARHANMQHSNREL